MHTNMTDDNLVSTATEEKKWRQLQHDAEWNDSDRTLRDRGRPEAGNSLTDKILKAATDILAIPSKTSKWTRIVIEMATEMKIPTTIHEIDD